MEYNKLITNKKLDAALKKFKFSAKEKALLRIMEKGERVEDVLSRVLLTMNPCAYQYTRCYIRHE